jgi:hypothetical protein
MSQASCLVVGESSLSGEELDRLVEALRGLDPLLAEMDMPGQQGYIVGKAIAQGGKT